MLAMAVTVLPSWPCIILLQTIEVGPDFRVKVEDGGRPVSALEVELHQGRDRKAAANTDEDGFALFRSIEPGSYSLRAHADAGNSNDLVIKVNRDGPDHVTIPVRWPSTTPIRVRSLKGWIRGPGYRPGVPQERLSLDLMEGMSGRKLKSFETGENGAFAIDGVVPGLYFLGLKPSNQFDHSSDDIVGTIPVAVDNGAPTDQLDIDIGQICGLWYLDQGSCPRKELQIGELIGQVVDSGGAAISNAKILLYDDKQALVDTRLSDNRGDFTSPHRWAGPYLLLVNAPGFSPFRGTVTIGPPDHPALSSSLKVQLGVGGVCSTANTK